MDPLQRTTSRASRSLLRKLLADARSGTCVAGGNGTAFAEVALAGALTDAIGVELARPGVVAEPAVKKVTLGKGANVSTAYFHTIQGQVCGG